MSDALRGLDYQVDESDLARRREQGKPIGRPHLADAVVRHPANRQRLESEGLAERSAFLEAYLIDGRPAFRPRTKPTIAESIETVHAAGGVAVWAHPFWDVKDPDAVLQAIDRFRAAGLDGVECFYVTHTREQTLLVADRCAELGLLTTGSSDFHGPEHRLFSRFRAFSTYGRRARARPDLRLTQPRLPRPTCPGNRRLPEHAARPQLGHQDSTISSSGWLSGRNTTSGCAATRRARRCQ